MAPTDRQDMRCHHGDMNIFRQLGVGAILIATLVVVAGCDVSVSFGDGETGSGTLVTETFDVGEFDTIAIGNSFEAFVTVGAERQVEVVVDDNLVDKLDIRVRNRELRVGLVGGTSLRSGTLEATIAVPELVALEVSGATSTDVDGVFGPRLEIDVSGASELSMQGSAGRVIVDASGASDVDLQLSDVGEVVVDVSGASSVDLLSAASVRGDLSGASDLTVPQAARVDVNSSGASDINRS